MKGTWRPHSPRSGPGSRASTPSSSETCFWRTFVPIGSGCWRGSACGDSFRCGCAILVRSRTNSSGWATARSEEHTSELQSRLHLVCRLLLEKKKKKRDNRYYVADVMTSTVHGEEHVVWRTAGK